MKQLTDKQEPTPLEKAFTACKYVFALSFTLGFMINILALATPLYSMQILDRVISSQSMETLVMLTIIMIVALAVLGLLQLVRSVMMARMALWLDKKLSPIILANSIASCATQRPTSGSQQLRDLNTIKSFLSSPTLGTVIDTPWAIIFLIVLFYLHPVMGILAIFGGASLICFALLTEYATKKTNDQSTEHYQKSMIYVDQTNRNAEVIEAMGFLGAITQKWQTFYDRWLDLNYLAQHRSSVLSELTKYVRLLLQISVTAIGAYLVITTQGGFTPGAIIASSALIGRALSPFEQSVAMWKNFINARASYEKLQQAFAAAPPHRDHNTRLPNPKGLIQAESITYQRPGQQKPIIFNVSFALQPGELLGVIGPSAAGKSTLARILVGAIEPTHGAVRLDGATLQQWHRDDITKHVGYLPQDIELFSGTVKENIARMQPDVPDQDVIDAATLAGVHDLILRLPNGYQTEIGPGGSMLSGGQRQRIALARAFFGSPRFVVLDEPNSNLDHEGEFALGQAMTQAKQQGTTIILISHRPSPVEVDRLLIMQEGQMTAFGPTKEVLARLEQAQQASKEKQEG